MPCEKWCLLSVVEVQAHLPVASFQVQCRETHSSGQRQYCRQFLVAGGNPSWWRHSASIVEAKIHFLTGTSTTGDDERLSDFSVILRCFMSSSISFTSACLASRNLSGGWRIGRVSPMLVHHELYPSANSHRFCCKNVLKIWVVLLRILGFSGVQVRPATWYHILQLLTKHSYPPRLGFQNVDQRCLCDRFTTDRDRASREHLVSVSHIHVSFWLELLSWLCTGLLGEK